MTGTIEITIKGEKRLVKFGNYALLEYGRMKNIGISEVNPSEDYFQFCVDIVWCGLKNVAYLKNEPLDVELSDVREAMDEIGQDELAEIITAYMASIKNSKFIQDAMKLVGGDSKKNSSGQI